MGGLVVAVGRPVDRSSRPRPRPRPRRRASRVAVGGPTCLGPLAGRLLGRPGSGGPVLDRRWGFVGVRVLAQGPEGLLRVGFDQGRAGAQGLAQGVGVGVDEGGEAGVGGEVDQFGVGVAGDARGETAGEDDGPRGGERRAEVGQEAGPLRRGDLRARFPETRHPARRRTVLRGVHDRDRAARRARDRGEAVRDAGRVQFLPQLRAGRAARQAEGEHRLAQRGQHARGVDALAARPRGDRADAVGRAGADAARDDIGDVEGGVQGDGDDHADSTTERVRCCGLSTSRPSRSARATPRRWTLTSSASGS